MEEFDSFIKGRETMSDMLFVFFCAENQVSKPSSILEILTTTYQALREAFDFRLKKR